jgi:hypothetical protein
MPAIPSIGNQDISFGTVEVLQTYGTVEQASLDEFQTEHEIPDTAGGIQALLLLNPGLEFKFTAYFKASMEKPARGTPIVFPYANVTGNVMGSSIKWESKTQRKIEITAKYWESMGSNPTVGTWDPEA